MAPFDHEVGQFMQARKIPGGALAVVRNGRLVYAREYGWADRKKEVSVRATSLFRIASVSKPFTAVSVLKLVEEGRLGLDDRVFDLIRLPPLLPSGKQRDPRLERITVRQLLHHTGGWDREKSFDPMFRSREIAEACSVPSPAGPTEIIRYMLGQPLDFDPGARTAYSNFGYCVLGRVIEHVAGAPYEKFVQESILAPAGIRRMRLGRSLAAQSASGEVCYYTAENGVTRSVFANESASVPWPYGGFCLEAMDAHGGWLASAVDLARFAAALDDPEHSPVLKSDTFHRLYAPPDAPVSRNPDGSLKDHFYACGWSVRPARQAGKANYWHNGSLPGTATLLVRRWDGLSWAVLFNQRSENPRLPDGAIDLALHRAADAVTEWPDEDLFPRYGV
ncbi:MAG: serine hydrolase domain-containing protein [Limisphaerales bacterium]